MRGTVVWFSRLRGKPGSLTVIIQWQRQVHDEWVRVMADDAAMHVN